MQGWLLDWGRHSTFDNGAWFLAKAISRNNGGLCTMNCICPVVCNPTGAEAYPTAVFWAPHTAEAVSNKEVNISTLWPARWASIAAE